MLTSRWPVGQPDGDDWRERRYLRGDAIQHAWVGFLGFLPWQLFVTLTIDPKRLSSGISCHRISREAFGWCNDACRTYRRPMGWVYAPERTRSGRWHAHALLIGVPVIRGEVSTLPEAAGIWKARNGRIDIRRVYEAAGAMLYATKQAAATGEIVVSDTLGTYRRSLAATRAVDLCP